MTQRPSPSQLSASISAPVESSAVILTEVGPRPLHLFLHIPKCAGQTIHEHLSRHLREKSYVRLRRRKAPGRLLRRQYRLDAALDPSAIDVITGHWVGPSIERHFNGRRIIRSILLRDPLSQFLSHYNHRMMRYLSRGMHIYPIDIAYRARPRNFLTNYILRNFAEIPLPRLALMTESGKYAEASRFLSECDFVGDHTRCSELIALIAPDLDIPAEAEATNTSEQWLQRVDWTPLTVNDVPPRLLEAIRRDNVVDQMLWETWKDAPARQPEAGEHDFSERERLRRAARQVSRLVNQARRRLHRRWGSGNGMESSD